MTFSIYVKELPEKCLRNVDLSDDYLESSCYPGYEYDLRYTKDFAFYMDKYSTVFYKEHSSYSSGNEGFIKLDKFEIQNKYSKLIISKSLKDSCTIKIDKDFSLLQCEGSQRNGGETILIKCEPSKILIVENNKGDSSASLDQNDLLLMVEYGFYKDIALVCPAVLGSSDDAVIDEL
jgi:hypothetical protein